MDYNSSFKIDKNIISVNADKVYFIADIGANHDGSIDRARELINQAAYAGANAVKFQHFTASTIASDKGFKDLTDIKSHQSKWKKVYMRLIKMLPLVLNGQHNSKYL